MPTLDASQRSICPHACVIRGVALSQCVHAPEVGRRRAATNGSCEPNAVVCPRCPHARRAVYCRQRADDLPDRQGANTRRCDLRSESRVRGCTGAVGHQGDDQRRGRRQGARPDSVHRRRRGRPRAYRLLDTRRAPRHGRQVRRRGKRRSRQVPRRPGTSTARPTAASPRTSSCLSATACRWRTARPRACCRRASRRASTAASSPWTTCPTWRLSRRREPIPSSPTVPTP